MLDRLKGGLSIAADTMQVLGFFGIAAAGTWGLIVLVVGYVSGIQWFWLLVALPVAIASILAIVRFFRPAPVMPILGPEEPFDATPWLNHETYTLWVAACLWIGMRPTPNIPAESPAYASLQKLKGAAITGKLATKFGHHAMNSILERPALVAYAQSINERPRFLFPDG